MSEDVKQETPQSNPKDLVSQMFCKFLNDAASMLGNNPTVQAHQARIKLEEALYWGRNAIFMYDAPEAPVAAPADQATAA